MKKFAGLAFVTLCLVVAACVPDRNEYLSPDSDQHLTDFVRRFDDDQRFKLTRELMSFEDTTGIKLQVISIDSFPDGYDRQMYASMLEKDFEMDQSGARRRVVIVLFDRKDPVPELPECRVDMLDNLPPGWRDALGNNTAARAMGRGHCLEAFLISLRRVETVLAPTFRPPPGSLHVYQLAPNTYVPTYVYGLAALCFIAGIALIRAAVRRLKKPTTSTASSGAAMEG